jgi:hypothetical protein
LGPAPKGAGLGVGLGVAGLAHSSCRDIVIPSQAERGASREVLAPAAFVSHDRACVRRCHPARTIPLRRSQPAPRPVTARHAPLSDAVPLRFSARRSRRRPTCSGLSVHSDRRPRGSCIASFLVARCTATRVGCRGPAGRSAASGGAHGVHTLRSVAPARGASDRSPVLLSHLPFPGSSAPIISSGDQLCVHEAFCADVAPPTLLGRQPIKEIRHGSWASIPAGNPCRASSSGRVVGRDCLGRRPLSGFRHARPMHTPVAHCSR